MHLASSERKGVLPVIRNVIGMTSWHTEQTWPLAKLSFSFFFKKKTCFLSSCFAVLCQNKTISPWVNGRQQFVLWMWGRNERETLRGQTHWAQWRAWRAQILPLSPSFSYHFLTVFPKCQTIYHWYCWHMTRLPFSDITRRNNQVKITN